MEYFAESHHNGSIVSYAKTNPENRIARHRKTESHSAPPQERRRAHPRVPNRTRGRAVDRRLSGQSLAAPGSDHDPDGFPPRAAGVRGLRPAMDPGGFRRCNARGHPSKARYAIDSPADRPGAAGSAPPAP